MSHLGISDQEIYALNLFTHPVLYYYKEGISTLSQGTLSLALAFYILLPRREYSFLTFRNQYLNLEHFNKEARTQIP